MTGSSAPDGLDDEALLRDVVRPVLDAMLRPGELDAVTITWERQLPTYEEYEQVKRRQPRPLRHDFPLGRARRRLTVVARGETTWVEPFELDDHGTDLGWLLADHLQDWIAESGFGWGELRPLPPSS